MSVCYNIYWRWEKLVGELTLLPSLIDQVFALRSAHFLIPCSLVKYLGCIRVCIVHTDDTMAPPLAKNAFTLAQEALLLAEVTHLRELVAQRFDFFSGLFWRAQRWRGNSWVRISWVIVVQCLANRLQCLHMTLRWSKVIASLVLVDERRVAFLFESRLAITFL